MIGSHVHQTITFYDGKDGELRIKFDDGAVEGRMVVDRIATEADKKAQSVAFAAYMRKKAPADTINASAVYAAPKPKRKRKKT